MTTNIHPADVKAALEKKGLTLTDVAHRNGLDSSTLRKSLRRPHATRVKAMIAAALGVPPQSIWPGLFNERGQAIRAEQRESITPRTARNVSRRIQRGAA